MSDRSELGAQEKQIIADVNQMVFPQFKERKKQIYSRLMKCGVDSSSHEQYFQCTDTILERERLVDEKLSNELIAYEKNYRLKLSKCFKSDYSCISSLHNSMRRDLTNIFSRYYSTTLI